RDLALRVDGDGGYGDAGVMIPAPAFGKERHPRKEILQRRFIRDGGEGIPLLPLRDPHVRLPRRKLRRVHQPAVVVLVTGNRRTPSLDRIGEETGRAVMVDACE